MKNDYPVDKKTVRAIISIRGCMDHNQLMDYFNCGYYTVDAVLRDLCKEGLIRHQPIYTKKGFRNQ